MKWFILLCAAALVFRIILIPVARHGDLNNNTSWGNLLIKNGPSGFYDEEEGWPFSAPNQPPLYLFVFGVTSFLYRLAQNTINFLNTNVSAFPSGVVWWYEQWGELYFAKFPGILGDVGIAFLICKYLKKNKKIALISASLWLVNPAVWYNSGIWGGTDSIVNFLGLLSFYFALKEKSIIKSSLALTVSLLFKSSFLILSPLLFFIFIWQKHSSNSWIKSFLLSLTLVLGVFLPFHMKLDLPVYIFNLYSIRFLPGEIGSLTANAFNFWWLVDSGKTLDSTIFFGLPARIWGYLMLLVVYLLALSKSKEGKLAGKVFLAAAVVSLGAFLFLTRIHERYMYPFFALATLAASVYPWVYVPLIVLSFINLLNLYHLFWAPGLPFIESWYTNPLFMSILATISVVLFGTTLVGLMKQKSNFT